MQNRISELIFRGKKLLAIKELRDSEGIDLRSAKEEVERLEAELKARVPDRFGLPGTPEAQKQVERIITKEDFLRALSSGPSGWSLSSFEKIPMGWSAKLSYEEKELSIWSHRFDIEASMSHFGHVDRDRPLPHPFPRTLSEFQQVQHILDGALKEI
jgi:hypothetical protein